MERKLECASGSGAGRASGANAPAKEQEKRSQAFEATEMAADDAAVSNESEALDLAAAIIKLSRVIPRGEAASANSAMALVRSAAASTNARVERLINWRDESRMPLQRYSSWCALSAGLATLAAFVVTYSELLVRVHTATEWLVR